MSDHPIPGTLTRPAPAALTREVDRLFCSPDTARYGPYQRRDEGTELLPGRLYRFPMLSPSLVPVTLQVFCDLKSISGQFWEQEVRVLLRVSALGHPALPRILAGGYDEDNNLAFVIAERAEHDLEVAGAMDLFRDRKADCVRHLGLLADALALLHGQGLMHRNLWPGSVEVVLLDDDPAAARLRLARFEMSTLLSNFMRRVHPREGGDNEFRQLYLAQGPRALAYCPRERLASLLGDRSVDTLETARSDVYGLGVLAWEWFVGPLPQELLARGAYGGINLGWVNTLHAAMMDGLNRARLPARLHDLLRGMLAMEHSSRLTSSAVVEELSRHYDSLLAVYEPTPNALPYLVAFMPRESKPTVHSWGWVAHDPETDEGRQELIEFLQAELRGARLVYSPNGADLSWVSGENRQKMRQARYVLLGRNGAWFCDLYEYRPRIGTGAEVMEEILLIRWVGLLSKAQELSTLRFQRRVSDVNAIPWTLPKADLDSFRRGRPSWRPLMAAVRVNDPAPPWQTTFQRAFDWLLDQQTVQLRAREYAFTCATGDGTWRNARLDYDQVRDERRIHTHPTALFSQLVSTKGRRATFGNFFGSQPEEGDSLKVEFRHDDGGWPGRWAGNGAVARRLDDEMIEVSVVEGTVPATGWVRPDEDFGTASALRRQHETAPEFLATKALLAHLHDPVPIQGPRDRWRDAGQGLGEGAAFVKDMLASQAFYALHGPPGTGKTTVVAHVVEAFLRAERGARLLISAQSNYALDNLALRILSRLKKQGLDVLAIRVTSPMAEDKVDDRLEPCRLENLVEQRIAQITADTEARLARRGEDLPPVRKVLGEWKSALQTSHLEMHDRLRRGANLVFATCLRATRRHVDAVGNFGIYDWVIVEEAAKAWPTELAIPLVRGSRWALIGDHRQLPAHQRREVEEFLRECATSVDETLRGHGEARADYARVFSLFGDLFERPPQGQQRGLGAPLGRMTKQFRMREPIAEVVSRAFYDGTLKTAASTEIDSMLTAPAALVGRALVWLDTEGVKDCSAQPRWWNRGEAQLVVALLRAMRPHPMTLKAPQDKEDDKPLAILTPYQQQKKILAAQTMPEGCAECISTVHEFQGREANVVITSLVRDNTKGTTDKDNLGYLVQAELVNVLFSRARRLLVVVGRFRHFLESGVPFWRDVCETVRQVGRVLPAADVVPDEGGA